MVKDFGATSDIGKLAGKLGYQMIGTSASSIGNNWARAKIESWCRDYNSYRPHSSLQDRTPEQVEFEVLNYRVNSNLVVSE